MTTTTTDKTMDTCNALLRGEISATETYAQAIAKYASTAEGKSLARIFAEHEKSADALRLLIQECGAEPSYSSGIWGGFVQALEGAATLMGESPALTILQQGEEHGRNVYLAALENADVSDQAKELIRQELLPPLTDHLNELQKLRETIA